MSIREVRTPYRSILDKIEKKLERQESMVLENYLELEGDILQLFWKLALVLKSEVFLSKSDFSLHIR